MARRSWVWFLECPACELDALKLASVLSIHRISSITTHAGFIPENPSDPLYKEVVEAVKEIGEHCGSGTSSSGLRRARKPRSLFAERWRIPGSTTSE